MFNSCRGMEKYSNLVDRVCGSPGNVDESLCPSPNLTSLPEVVADQIRESLSFQDLANVLKAFPVSNDIALVTTKDLVTGRMKEHKYCDEMKAYAYNLNLLQGNHFPSIRRWYRILSYGIANEPQKCELCGSRKETRFSASYNLFVCQHDCSKSTLLSQVGIKNSLQKLTWSDEQQEECRTTRIIHLPVFSIQKPVKDEFTGEPCGPLCTSKEISSKLSIRELSLRYPSFYEQQQRLNLMTHFLKACGAPMDYWTPVTALLVANYKILEKRVEEIQQKKPPAKPSGTSKEQVPAETK